LLWRTCHRAFFLPNLWVSWTRLQAVGAGGFRRADTKNLSRLRMLPDCYFKMNSALNAYFFDGRFEHRPIYIDLEGEAAEVVAEAVGVDEEALGNHVGKAVATTLRLEQANPYSQQLQWLRMWNEAG